MSYFYYYFYLCFFLAQINYNFLDCISALYLDLHGREETLKLGWVCPYEIHDKKCLSNPPDVKDYLHRVPKEAMQSKKKFILAPYLESYDLYCCLLIFKL